MVKYENRLTLTVTFEGDDAVCMVNLFKNYADRVAGTLEPLNREYASSIKRILRRVAKELDDLGVK